MNATQPALDLRNADGTRLDFRKPMLGMEAAKGAMGLTEDEVLAEISLRNLRWAFDLRTPDANKIFLRVSTRAVAAWGNPKIPLPTKLDEILAWILPPKSAVTGVIEGTQLEHCANVTSGHVHNLIACGLLQSLGVAGAKGKHGRRGPGGSPNVTRASVEKLLKERLL